ncbi:MAG: tetratricopeptide repeat protein, partial [Calditrichia bacterium]
SDIFDLNELNQKMKRWEKENNWQAIVQELKPLCQKGNPGWSDAMMLRSLGFACTQLDQLDQALICYTRWIELEPERAQPYYSLGYVFYLQKNWATAVDWFEKALEKYPDYLVCRYRLAYSYWAMDKSRLASPHLEHVREVWQAEKDEFRKKQQLKTYVKTGFLYGKVLLRLKDFNRSVAVLEETMELNKDKYLSVNHIYYELGKAHGKAGETGRALSCLQQALNPHRPQEYVLDQIGRVYAGRQDYEKALEYFDRALRQRRKPYILLNRALVLMETGKLNPALRDLCEALKRDQKGKHKIRLQMARVYREMGKWPEMKGELLRAIQFKQQVYGSDYAEAHLLLSEYYRQCGQPEQAGEEYRIALAIQPDLEFERVETSRVSPDSEAAEIF